MQKFEAPVILCRTFEDNAKSVEGHSKVSIHPLLKGHCPLLRTTEVSFILNGNIFYKPGLINPFFGYSLHTEGAQ